MVLLCLGVVAMWSLYGGDVEACRGVVVVSEVVWDEGQGVHQDNLNMNDERRQCRRSRRSSFG